MDLLTYGLEVLLCANYWFSNFLTLSSNVILLVGSWRSGYRACLSFK